jgi:hypothetical protein
MSDRSALARLLERDPWVLCNDPFPHIRARAVFTPAVYSELDAAFETLLGGRQLPSWTDARFSRNMPGYDASAIDFDICVGWPFSLFASRPWHDLFARLLDVDAIGYVSGALHHHAAGSRDGAVHNDLNPGWFAARDSGEEIVIPRGDLCNYRNGMTLADANVTAFETMRGVAVIYYLNNPQWCPGDGGETGLYRAARDVTANCVVAVPPLNNSLVAFECTPNSFHAFRTNPRHPRNSVCVWLHRPKETVLDKWGSSAIVPWQ